MPKENLITITQLKKMITNLERDEYIKLITEIAQACPQAREFLTVKFSDAENINEIFEKYKQKVENEFFPKKGYGKLNLRKRKKPFPISKKSVLTKQWELTLCYFMLKTALNLLIPTATSMKLFTTALPMHMVKL